MDYKELRELIRAGEGQYLEFKRSIKPKKLGPAICAFANAEGGKILVGVNDDGSIVGVKDSNDLRSQYQTVARNIEPPVEVEINPINTKEGNVICIDVLQQGPCSVRGEFYIREGANSQKVTYVELIKRYSNRGRLTWDQPRYSSYLAVANLVGAWDGSNQKDFEIIEKMSGMKYCDWIHKIEEMSQEYGSPLECIGNKWKIRDRKLVWGISKKAMFDAALDRFQGCAISVLSEKDPKFDLPLDQRFAATICGKVFKYSNELRNGLAETLALLGNNADDLEQCSLSKPRTVTFHVIRQVLHNTDWVIWGSLNDLLPTIAESDPKEFLRVTDEILRKSSDTFRTLFSQEHSVGGIYHVGLIIALEILAREAEFFFKSCMILAGMDVCDPGGEYSDRPFQSLEKILLTGYRYTAAPFEKRKALVQKLQKEYPSLSWKLLLNLPPILNLGFSIIRFPSWRKINPENYTEHVKEDERQAQAEACFEFLISMAMDDCQKAAELIGKSTHLSGDYVKKLIVSLRSDTTKKWNEADRREVWKQLVEMVEHHREYSFTSWALGSDILGQIEEVAKEFEPEKPRYRHHRLFSNKRHYRETGDPNTTIESRRRRALREILNYGGFQEILEFVDLVDDPYLIGLSLGEIGSSEVDSYIFPQMLDSENDDRFCLAKGYTWSRFQQRGESWMDVIIQSEWSHEQIAQFLAFLPLAREIWGRANLLLGENERYYWERVEHYRIEHDFEYAINKLIDYGRPRAAFLLTQFNQPDNWVDECPNTCIRLLLEAASSSENINMDSYSLGEFIQKLQRNPRVEKDSLIKIEWSYLDVLNRHYGFSPKAIEAHLASDPGFFCDLLFRLYSSRQERGDDEESTEQSDGISSRIWKILHNWRLPPGTQSDGSMSQPMLDDWMSQVKEKCSREGLLEEALGHVGKALFYSPLDPSGIFVHRAVAEVLDDPDHDEMRNAFEIEALHPGEFRRVDHSGAKDREIAREYRSKADQIENEGFGRFAETLREIASCYDRKAERHIADHREMTD